MKKKILRFAPYHARQDIFVRLDFKILIKTPLLLVGSRTKKKKQTKKCIASSEGHTMKTDSPPFVLRDMIEK